MVTGPLNLRGEMRITTFWFPVNQLPHQPVSKNDARASEIFPACFCIGWTETAYHCLGYSYTVFLINGINLAWINVLLSISSAELFLLSSYIARYSNPQSILIFLYYKHMDMSNHGEWHNFFTYSYFKQDDSNAP